MTKQTIGSLKIGTLSALTVLGLGLGGIHLNKTVNPDLEYNKQAKEWNNVLEGVECTKTIIKDGETSIEKENKYLKPSEIDKLLEDGIELTVVDGYKKVYPILNKELGNEYKTKEHTITITGNSDSLIEDIENQTFNYDDYKGYETKKVQEVYDESMSEDTSYIIESNYSLIENSKRLSGLSSNQKTEDIIYKTLVSILGTIAFGVSYIYSKDKKRKEQKDSYSPKHYTSHILDDCEIIDTYEDDRYKEEYQLVR